MRKAAAILFGIGIFSGLAFLGLYVFRADLYALAEVKLAAVAELYLVSPTAVAVVDYDTEPGRVFVPRLRNVDHCTGWSIESEGMEFSRSTGSLRIPVRPGIHDYIASPQGCSIDEPAVDALRFNLFFGNTASFGEQDLSDDQYQVNSINVPTLLGDPLPFSRWVPDVEAVSPNEAVQARKALIAAGFKPAAPTREKIEFLVAFVRRHMPSGSPPAYLNALSPWRVFLEGDLKKVGCFCRQWSLVYGYLANVVGIPTRNLFTGGRWMTSISDLTHFRKAIFARRLVGPSSIRPTTSPTLPIRRGMC